jgi:gluconokinase
MNDLSAIPHVWFLFGLSGSGKSYVGDVIARHTGWDIYHADEDITPEMKLALAESRPFTIAMRDEYFRLLVQKIRERQRPDRPLLVTQGAYKQHSRDFLQRHITGLQFVWVDAPDQLVVERLKHRLDGISTRSAAALRGDFEPPVDGLCIVNDAGEQAILNQFQDCLARFQQLARNGG